MAIKQWPMSALKGERHQGSVLAAAWLAWKLRVARELRGSTSLHQTALRTQNSASHGYQPCHDISSTASDTLIHDHANSQIPTPPRPHLSVLLTWSGRGRGRPPACGRTRVGLLSCGAGRRRAPGPVRRCPARTGCRAACRGAAAAGGPADAPRDAGSAGSGTTVSPVEDGPFLTLLTAYTAWHQDNDNLS